MLKKFEELEAKYDDMCNEKGVTCNGCRYDVDGMNCGMMFAYEQGRAEAIDEFVKFANTMPTVETDDGEIRPMWLEEMAEQLKEENK